MEVVQMSNLLQNNLDQILQEKNTKLLPENIKKDVQIFDIVGTLEEGIDTSDATATAKDIVQGATAYVNGEKITGSMPNNGELNYTPSEQEQIIPAGYTSGGTVSAAVMTNDDYQTCMDLANYILYGGESPILYTELEYIQGTGTQWIDTGITMTWWAGWK